MMCLTLSYYKLKRSDDELLSSLSVCRPSSVKSSPLRPLVQFQQTLTWIILKVSTNRIISHNSANHPTMVNSLSDSMALRLK